MRALVNGVFKDLPGRERAPREDPHRVREDPALRSYHPEDSKHSGSGRIEFSSKSTTFLM